MQHVYSFSLFFSHLWVHKSSSACEFRWLQTADGAARSRSEHFGLCIGSSHIWASGGAALLMCWGALGIRYRDTGSEWPRREKNPLSSALCVNKLCKTSKKKSSKFSSSFPLKSSLQKFGYFPLSDRCCCYMRMPFLNSMCHLSHQQVEGVQASPQTLCVRHLYQIGENWNI